MNSQSQDLGKTSLARARVFAACTVRVHVVESHTRARAHSIARRHYFGKLFANKFECVEIANL